MSYTANSRLRDELDLLSAMYPSELSFNDKTADLSFHNESGSFTLRIDDCYPEKCRPTVIAAHTSMSKTDVREKLREAIANLTVGEAMIDLIIASFNDTVTSETASPQLATLDQRESMSSDREVMRNTTVIWLHHLLNTNKRKQVLHPASNELSGVSKPGYPGVLIFAGPKRAVHEHVASLKQLNWQAFQVRLDDASEWTFQHGHGVKEVETMGEVVLAIGESRKEAFLEAMHMK